MRPFYIFLLAGSHSPQALGFCSPPSAFVSQPLAPKSQLTSTGHAAPSRRTGDRTSCTTTTTAASCRRDRHGATRQQGSPVDSLGESRRYRPLRWAGRSASTRAAQRAASSSAVASSRISSSTSGTERGPRTSASVMSADTKTASSVITSRVDGAELGGDGADPTAAAHAYLAEFLGMTKEVGKFSTTASGVLFGLLVCQGCMHLHHRCKAGWDDRERSLSCQVSAQSACES